jgi:D-arabinose 1-dehydrogenase-like Zn-dependent alcohol dehydrogenase
MRVRNSWACTHDGPQERNALKAHVHKHQGPFWQVPQEAEGHRPLVGVGGVGEAIAAIAKPRAWMEQMVLADYNVKRAEEVQKKMGDSARFPIEFIDASNQQMIEDLAKKYGVDLVMNSVDPFSISRYSMPL